MALGDVIARLSVSLGLETTAFERGSRNAQKEVQSLGKKMSRVAGAIGTAFVASIGVDTVRSLVDMGKAAVDTVGALGEQAQQLGVTTDALQEFRFVASQTGIEQAEIDKALQRLTRTIGDLEEPTKAQAAAMKALGLSTNSLKGLGADQALVVLSEAFNRLPDAAKRSAVGFDLMGKSFQTLLPLLNEGPERINAMVKAAHDLGIVLTSEQIAAADSYADQITALNLSVDAQKAAALTRYGEGLVKLTRDYTQFQIDLVKAFVAIDEAGTGLTKTLQDFGKNTGIQDFFASIPGVASGFLQFFKDLGSLAYDAAAAVGRMVSSIASSVGGTLRAVWDSAINKIGALGEKFRWLYDVVVGHSYIPDMVDGIAAHMARLDSVMVKPAEKATAATARKFQELRDLLDRLFPEVGKAGGFNADLSRIMGSALNDNEKTEATMRLWREFLSGSPFGGGGIGRPDFGSDGGPLVEGIEAAEDAIDRLASKSKLNTVRIADSFKDMADKTLASLSRLTSAVKGGGFLNILEAVIGVGLQLGSIGAFGKSIQTNINRVPGYAGGTSFHPGGLAMVGERGPELVSMPRGSRVTPNAELGGRQLIEIVDTTGLFRMRVNGQIMEAAPAIAQAGAQGGVALGQYRQSRRWR